MQRNVSKETPCDQPSEVHICAILCIVTLKSMLNQAKRAVQYVAGHAQACVVRESDKVSEWTYLFKMTKGSFEECTVACAGILVTLHSCVQYFVLFWVVVDIVNRGRRSRVAMLKGLRKEEKIFAFEYFRMSLFLWLFKSRSKLFLMWRLFLWCCLLEVEGREMVAVWIYMIYFIFSTSSALIIVRYSLACCQKYQNSLWKAFSSCSSLIFTALPDNYPWSGVTWFLTEHFKEVEEVIIHTTLC